MIQPIGAFPRIISIIDKRVFAATRHQPRSTPSDAYPRHVSWAYFHQQASFANTPNCAQSSCCEPLADLGTNFLETVVFTAVTRL